MKILDLLNNDLLFPTALALVIMVYIMRRIRNNKKYKR